MITLIKKMTLAWHLLLNENFSIIIIITLQILIRLFSDLPVCEEP